MPKVLKSKEKKESHIETLTRVPFTGVSRSVECYRQQNHNNFRIVTLYIEDGFVVKKEVSDPYASFEAIARLEIMCHQATLNLNNGYKNGVAWAK